MNNLQEFQKDTYVQIVESLLDEIVKYVLLRNNLLSFVVEKIAEYCYKQKYTGITLENTLRLPLPTMIDWSDEELPIITTIYNQCEILKNI